MKTWPIWAFIFFLSLSAPTSKAEYRLYQYAVIPIEYSVLSPQMSLVTTTLDPQSFVAYHGGPSSIQADLLRTWACPGYTGNNTPHFSAPGDTDRKDQEVP